jgi:hypothetical protein
LTGLPEWGNDAWLAVLVGALVVLLLLAWIAT